MLLKVREERYPGFERTCDDRTRLASREEFMLRDINRQLWSEDTEALVLAGVETRVYYLVEEEAV